MFDVFINKLGFGMSISWFKADAFNFIVSFDGDPGLLPFLYYGNPFSYLIEPLFLLNCVRGLC